MADRDVKKLKTILGHIVYGKDKETMSQALAKLLIKKKYTVAAAESCSGGLIAKMLTDNPGSSEYFTQAMVTYSNKAKQTQLDIPAEVIEKYGAVSPQVAEAMAINVAHKAGTETAVSTTGIAGPAGRTEQKPVGLVYIGVFIAGRCFVKEHHFPGGRNSVRNRTALSALNMLRLKLLI
jgi:nicotinamide-nucleotide amidase